MILTLGLSRPRMSQVTTHVRDMKFQSDVTKYADLLRQKLSGSNFGPHMDGRVG